MPQTQDTDENVAPVDDFTPRPASTHLSVTNRIDQVVPERNGIWPLAPWRWVLLAIAMFLTATCGPAAAAPIWNTADLLVFISLGVFVAAFTPGRD
jgi:hypothetical protein